MTELSIIGLMSGTSADGIDAAVLITDGVQVTRTASCGHFAYRQDTREAIRACCADPAMFLADATARINLDTAIAVDHAAAVEALCRQFGDRVDLIGFHGQTVYHNACADTVHPLGRQTIQLGDANYLAKVSSINVVHNVRQADMDAGGQGAPLAPIYHAAVCGAMQIDMPAVLVNIGGVANLTYVSADDPNDLIGFDTGPGNALLDDFMMSKLHEACDLDGALAATGTANQVLIANWMTHPYFTQKWPKSLDRQEFSRQLLDPNFARLSVADAAATLTSFTAQTIAHAIGKLPTPPRSVFVAGGGRRNITMMRDLSSCLSMPVVTQKTEAFDADMLEAELMAFLAARFHYGLPTSFPHTTGCRRPVSGGQLALAR
ncbi:MAG: anhydro-N-acetylmuramic acid kinase [Candidatus Puniceispirillaceae bacterium]